MSVLRPYWKINFIYLLWKLELPKSVFNSKILLKTFQRQKTFKFAKAHCHKSIKHIFLIYLFFLILELKKLKLFFWWKFLWNKLLQKMILLKWFKFIDLKINKSFSLIDLSQSDIQVFYSLQIDNDNQQCVSSSWTWIFKNRFVVHGQYVRFATPLPPFIQALLSTALFPQRFSFFSVS